MITFTRIGSVPSDETREGARYVVITPETLAAFRHSCQGATEDTDLRASHERHYIELVGYEPTRGDY